MEKNSAFECGFSSFLGQNRTQFSISFFIFALLFLLFDLEILLVYPYLVSAYVNEIYGLAILLIFLIALTLGFVFELGKKALTIDSKQTKNNSKNKKLVAKSKTQKNNISYIHNSLIIQSSFSNYKIFNRNFWRTYFYTLKTKYTRRYFIIILSSLIVSYVIKQCLIRWLELDMNNFYHVPFMVACAGFLTAIVHLIESIFSIQEPMTMGPNETINIEIPEQTDKIKNVFMANGVGEENNSVGNNEPKTTNDAEPSTTNNPANLGDSVDTPHPPFEEVTNAIRRKLNDKIHEQLGIVDGFDDLLGRDDITGITKVVLETARTRAEDKGGNLIDKEDHLFNVMEVAKEREKQGESLDAIVEAYKNQELILTRVRTIHWKEAVESPEDKDPLIAYTKEIGEDGKECYMPCSTTKTNIKDQPWLVGHLETSVEHLETSRKVRGESVETSEFYDKPVETSGESHKEIVKTTIPFILNNEAVETTSANEVVETTPANGRKRQIEVDGAVETNLRKKVREWDDGGERE